MQLDGNILILGDSFCQNKEGWPDMLCEKFSYNIAITQGTPGVGWWAIRSNLLQCQQQSDFFLDTKLLIFIHTQKSRLFKQDLSLFNILPQELPLSYSNNSIDEKTLSVSLYYKYIHEVLFADWAEQQWFREFKEICKPIPLIVNLFFETQKILPTLPGICVPTGLLDLNKAQYRQPTSMAFDGLKGYINHFTPENNKIFANQLYNIICGKSIDFDITEFTKGFDE